MEGTNSRVPKQNSFRKTKSTTKALATIIDHILMANNGEKLAVAVFLDLKNAFDIGNHQILAWKLERAHLSDSLKTTWPVESRSQR